MNSIEIVPCKCEGMNWNWYSLVAVNYDTQCAVVLWEARFHKYDYAQGADIVDAIQAAHGAKLSHYMIGECPTEFGQPRIATSVVVDGNEYMLFPVSRFELGKQF